jgi:hypothetical protein
LSLAWQQRSDNLAIAQRLVGFLPVRGHVAELGRQRTGAWDKTYSNAVTLLACLALGAAVLLVML